RGRSSPRLARALRRSPRTTDARACRADEGASRSPATRPAQGRRTRAASRSSLLLRSGPRPPHDDAAAETEAPRADTGDPGRTPERGECVPGMALPEAADARAEEPADVAPGRRDERARGGQADA